MAQNPFSPAQIDFSTLANLPGAYRQGQQWRREDDLRDAFSGGLPKGPNGEIDWSAAYDTLAQHDPASALKLARGGANGGSSVFGTPIYGEGGRVGVIPKAGGAVQWLDTGGVGVSEPYKYLETPGGYVAAPTRGPRQPLPGQGGSAPVIPSLGAEKFKTERQATADKAAESGRMRQIQATIVNDDIERARKTIRGQGNIPATGFGSYLSGVPGTDAHQLANTLETVKSNIGFDKLQAMRDASPTGGALGAVSEFENRLLQAVYGSLAQSQTDEDLLYNLDRLERTYNAIIHKGIRPEEVHEYLPGAPTSSSTNRAPSQQQVSGGPQQGEVVNGYRFKGGNPNDPNAWEQVR